MDVTAMSDRSRNISEIELRIAEIIVDELKIEDATPQRFDVHLDLVDELGIDSMDLATVALVLNDEFDIEIYEEDYPKLNTIQLNAEYIRERLRESSE